MSSVPPDPRLLFVVGAAPDEQHTFAAHAWMTQLASEGYDVTALALGGALREAPPSPVHVLRSTEAGDLRPTRIVADVLTRRPCDVVLPLGLDAAVAVSGAVKRLSARPLVVAVGPVGATKTTLRSADVVVTHSHPDAAAISAAGGVPASRSLVVPLPVAEPDLAPHARRAPGDTMSIVVVGEPARADASVLDDAIRILRGRVSSVASRRFAGWQGDEFADAVMFLAGGGAANASVLVEAAARGIPSVASPDVLAAADTIVPGVTGHLVMERAASALAQAVAAAREIVIGDIDPWLARFTVEASSRQLGRAVQYATTLPGRS